MRRSLFYNVVIVRPKGAVFYLWGPSLTHLTKNIKKIMIEMGREVSANLIFPYRNRWSVEREG